MGVRWRSALSTSSCFSWTKRTTFHLLQQTSNLPIPRGLLTTHLKALLGVFDILLSVYQGLTLLGTSVRPRGSYSFPSSAVPSRPWSQNGTDQYIKAKS